MYMHNSPSKTLTLYIESKNERGSLRVKSEYSRSMTTNARAASRFVVQGLMLLISGVKAKEKLIVIYIGCV
jgi:hypothetical protein